MSLQANKQMKQSFSARVFSLVFVTVILHTPAQAVEAPKPALPSTLPQDFSPRSNAWGLGLQLLRPQYVTEDESKRSWANLIPTLTISRVWLNPQSWGTIDLRIVLGPNSQRFEDSPALDYTGFGLGAAWGMSMGSLPLRQTTGDWGFLVAAQIDDLRGRSFRPRLLADGNLSDNWVVSVRTTSLGPGLFYARLEEARPKGHRPEWLMTRLEGYLWQLTALYTAQGTLDYSATLGRTSKGEHKPLHGFGIALSFSAWLGI